MRAEEYNDIVRHWIDSVLQNRGRDAELTIKCCGDLISYGGKMGDNTLVGFGYYYMGETYYCLNDGARFFDAVSMALSYLDKAGEWELMARCYNFLGIWAMNRGNAPVAQDYYLNGISYCRKYHLPKMEVWLNINMGALHIQCRRYEEAQSYLEQALSYMQGEVEDSDYHGYMLSIYQNLAKSLIPQEKYDRVEEIFRRIYHDHWGVADDMAKLTVLCTEAIYNDAIGDEPKRDHCIGLIRDAVPENVAILDMFDDFYDYVSMLFSIGKEEEFWQLVDIMEPLLKTCNIIKMQLRLIALKLRYYRKYGKNAEFLQAAGLYYELSELMEEETRVMMNNVLTLRRNLENANKARKEMELQNRILLEKSEMDPLTKLANRFRLNDYSEEVFSRVRDTGKSFAIEILDIDYFKEFNDNYGHQAGDTCLVKVAEALKHMASAHGAFCARYGGDEFVIIYEGVTKEQAQEYAGELREKVCGLGIEHKFSKAAPHVTISQGLCWGFPDKKNRIWDYLHAADEALYKVKKKSRDSYTVNEFQEA